MFSKILNIIILLILVAFLLGACGRGFGYHGGFFPGPGFWHSSGYCGGYGNGAAGWPPRHAGGR